MYRFMKVTIGIEINEEDVKNYVKSYGGDPDKIEDADWCEYAAYKYTEGLGAEAWFD